MASLGIDEKSMATRDADAWEECEDVSGLSLSLLALVGALGSAVALPLATAGVFLALAKYKKNAARHLAKDPPDANYEQPVHVGRPSIRSSAFGPQERTGPLGAAATAVAEQAAVLDAFVSTVERADGARAAEARTALEDRLEEAVALGRQAATLLQAGTRPIEDLARAIETSAPRPARGGFRSEDLTLRAVLLEAEDPMEAILQRVPDDILALLFRAGFSSDDLRFDPKRATARESAVELILSWPAGALAQALRQGAKSSFALGVVIAEWLPDAAERMDDR